MNKRSCGQMKRQRLMQEAEGFSKGFLLARIKQQQG
jgi:hypothetical protein